MMIQTVCGPIAPAALGRTLPHEHLLWDQSCYWPGEPADPSARAYAHAPVDLALRGRLFYEPFLNRDNLRQLDPELAIEELRHFQAAGGRSVVDVSSIGLARNPEALCRIARQTGVNIVMGSGYYVGAAQPPEIGALTVDEIAASIVAELRVGVGTTGIRPGVIGEIGLTDIVNESDLRHLRAAARAQRETGAPLYIHPPHREKGLAILDILEAEGGILAKTVLCHCGQTPDSPDYYHAIARRGAYVEFDQFGVNLVAGGQFLPCDQERILQVKAQVERGHLERILISQDVCFKMCLVRYGGWGYGHILRNLFPFFLQAGLTAAQLDTLMIANPARLLAW